MPAWNPTAYIVSTPPNPLLSLSALNLHGTSAAGVVAAQPLINFLQAADGGAEVNKWQIGLDSSNGLNDDLVLAARNNGGSVTDFLVRPKECEQS
jgi:hypothetical protein